jgi:ABC-type Fe3+-hydroxamate transport system substrate-binding protein
MPAFTDQLGRTIVLPGIPRRIISLVPSQTELLYTLGLDDSVVGITKFCVHPESWFRTKTRIGGTKAIDAARIDALQPDLIIANKEENDRHQVEARAGRYPVWVSDIKTLPDALAMIRSVGEFTGTTAAADTLAAEIAHRFATLEPPPKRPNAAYLIWRNPWMAAGGDTFIHHMLEQAGFLNVFDGQNRYPEVDLNSMAHAGCPVILLSSEPYPFRRQHIDEVKEVMPHARVLLVDGELFSWYGSRLLLAPDYFRQLQTNIRATT